MPDGLITSRPIQNESTGMDLQVPAYQEVRGAMMSGHVEYKIIVVTRLAAFKSPRHKPADTVQLVVSKQFSDIDEFHSRLAAQYPRLPLPAMPRKALLVGEADIRDRRVAFDALMRFIAKDPTLATAPEVLDFLGAKTTDVKTRNALLGEEPEEEEINFFQEEEASVPRKTSFLPPERPREDTSEEEPYLGPLGNSKSKKTKPHLPPKPTKGSLFGGDQSPDADLCSSAAKEDGLKLFQDPWRGGSEELGAVWLPPPSPTQAGSSGCTGQDEDMEQLFRVDHDFERILQLTRPTQSRAPGCGLGPPGALAPRGGGGPGVGPHPVAVEQLKDQTDILKYIQQNELEANWEDDLF